jgi:hypothetical protein
MELFPRLKIKSSHSPLGISIEAIVAINDDTYLLTVYEGDTKFAIRAYLIFYFISGVILTQ